MRTKYPDAHYADVAEVYTWARELGHRPNITVAEEYGVPITTAARWVKRAKELGLLNASPICRGRCAACCTREAPA